MKLPVTSRFRTVHIDIVGPLKTARSGKQYILTMMDRFSRWVEAIPLTNIRAETVCRHFYSDWVCRFRVPDYVITDQGSQFESAMFKEMLQSMDIKRCRTTAYHPEPNGMIERMHSTLKTTLRCLADTFPDWVAALPTALLAIRSAVNDRGISPTLVIYGEQTTVPGVFAMPRRTFTEESEISFVNQLHKHWLQVKEFILATDPTLSPAVPSGKPPPEFPHDNVWIVEPIKKGSLEPKVRGPYKVLEVKYPVVFVKVDGVKQAISVDRCKPAFILKYDILNKKMPVPIWKDFKEDGYSEDEGDGGKINGEILPRTIGNLVLPVLDMQKYANKLPFANDKESHRRRYPTRHRMSAGLNAAK